MNTSNTSFPSSPDDPMQIYVISFNGWGTSMRDDGLFSSSRLDNPFSSESNLKDEKTTTGMRQLNDYLENRFTDHPHAMMEIHNYNYTEVAKAVSDTVNELQCRQIDQLVVIGHSYGGRATYQFADQLSQQLPEQKIDLQIPIDAVGWDHPEKPANVEQTFNFYHNQWGWDKDSFSVDRYFPDRSNLPQWLPEIPSVSRFGVDKTVEQAQNINVEQMFNKELGHGTIDNFSPLHQAIGNLIEHQIYSSPSLEQKILNTSPNSSLSYPLNQSLEPNLSPDLNSNLELNLEP